MLPLRVPVPPEVEGLPLTDGVAQPLSDGAVEPVRSKEGVSAPVWDIVGLGVSEALPQALAAALALTEREGVALEVGTLLPLAPLEALAPPVGEGEKETDPVGVGVAAPPLADAAGVELLPPLPVGGALQEALPEPLGQPDVEGVAMKEALATREAVPFGVELMDAVGRPLALGTVLPLPRACVPLTVPVAEMHAVAEGGMVGEAPAVLVPHEGVGEKEAAADAESSAVAVPQAVAQAEELAQAVAGALPEGCSDALAGGVAEEVPQPDWVAGGVGVADPLPLATAVSEGDTVPQPLAETVTLPLPAAVPELLPLSEALPNGEGDALPVLLPPPARVFVGCSAVPLPLGVPPRVGVFKLEGVLLPPLALALLLRGGEAVSLGDSDTVPTPLAHVVTVGSAVGEDPSPWEAEGAPDTEPKPLALALPVNAALPQAEGLPECEPVGCEEGEAQGLATPEGERRVVALCVAEWQGETNGEAERGALPLGAPLAEGLHVGELLGENACEALAQPLALRLRVGEPEALAQAVSLPLKVGEPEGPPLTDTRKEMEAQPLEEADRVGEGLPLGVALGERERVVQPLALAQGVPLREAVCDPDALGQPLPLPLREGEAVGAWLRLGRGVADEHPEEEPVLERAPLPEAEVHAEREWVGLPLALAQGEPLRVAFGEFEALEQPLPLPLADGDGDGEWLRLKRGVADTQPEGEPVLEGAPLPVAEAHAERENVGLPLALAQGEPLRVAEGDIDALGQPLPLPLIDGDVVCVRLRLVRLVVDA